MKVEETADYDLFKRHESNRDVNEKKVLALMKSIAEKNQLRSKPILVDNDGNVIDGQHRLEAARRLGIAIPFYIDANADINDVVRLNNNQDVWKAADYLKHYASKGSQEYVKLKSFIDVEKISLNVALQLLNGQRSMHFHRKFKQGDYTFPSEIEYQEALERNERIKEVIDFIKKRTSGNKAYLDRVTFYSALVNFYNITSFSHEVFMHKLSQRLNLMSPRTRECDYAVLFKEIYNFKTAKDKHIVIPEEMSGT